MNYYDEDEKKKRRWAILAVLLYLAVYWGGMRMTHTVTTEQTLQGIVIDFGSSDPALDAAESDVESHEASPIAPPPTETPDEAILTDDDGRVEVTDSRPDVANAQRQPDAPTPRAVDRRALFPGNTAQTASQTDTEPTQRSSELAASADSQFAVSGVDNVDGRRLVEDLPLPAYEVDQEGKVVVIITVDADGKVTSARADLAGTTTTSGTLKTAAEAAARKARFEEADVALQSGTITYSFRINK